MARSHRTALRQAWVLLTLALAGCTGLPLGTAEQLRNLDFYSDDLADAVLAIEVPPGIEPRPGGTRLHVALTALSGRREFDAALERADADEIGEGLDPPTAGRAYYLFRLGQDDRARLAELQAWARGQGGDSRQPILPDVEVVPDFCAEGVLDVKPLTYSVLLAIPGAGQLAPLGRDIPVGGTNAPGAALALPLCSR